jgi:hypothetical protein
MGEIERKEETAALGHSSRRMAHQFDAQAKALFLDAYFKHGNMSKAADATGFSRVAVWQHLERDKRFKHDFEMTKRAIKHQLEEVMLENAKDKRGYLDRITFLRRHYPEEYNPKIQEMAYLAKDTNKLGKLMDILDAKVVDVKDISKDKGSESSS